MPKGPESIPSAPKNAPQTLRSPEEYGVALEQERLSKTTLQERIGQVESEYFQDFDILNESNLEIGTLELGYDEDKLGAWLMEMYIQAEHTGKGYGKSAYTNLVTSLAGRGIRLRSGDSLSREAKGMWEWMVRQGVARKISDGITDESKEALAYSTAQYEII